MKKTKQTLEKDLKKIIKIQEAIIKNNEIERNKILFLGNDSKRDYIFLEKLVREMPEKSS